MAKPERIVRVDANMLTGTLRGVRRPQPVGVVAWTVPAMNSGNKDNRNPFFTARVDSVAQFDLIRARWLTGWVCVNYQRAVNRRRDVEGVATDEMFETSGRSWGDHFYAGTEFDGEAIRKASKRTALVRHGSKWYLNLTHRRTREVRHYRPSTGELVSNELVEPWLKRTTSNADAKRQGVSRAVIVRDYSITNIQILTVARTQYRVTTCQHANQFPKQIPDSGIRNSAGRNESAGSPSLC